MTQEEKQLLLKVISAMFPYNIVILADEGLISRLIGIITITKKKNIREQRFYVNGCVTPFSIEEIKPYLRPMSSMTDDELKKVGKLSSNCSTIGILNYNGNDSIWEWGGYQTYTLELIDYFNSIHIDYCGLIEKGLAIEITEKNNPYNY